MNADVKGEAEASSPVLNLPLSMDPGLRRDDGQTTQSTALHDALIGRAERPYGAAWP
jgi:hypothetical protein